MWALSSEQEVGHRGLLQGRGPPGAAPLTGTLGAMVHVNIRGDPEATGRWAARWQAS